MCEFDAERSELFFLLAGGDCVNEQTLELVHERAHKEVVPIGCGGEKRAAFRSAPAPRPPQAARANAVAAIPPPEDLLARLSAQPPQSAHGDVTVE